MTKRLALLLLCATGCGFCSPPPVTRDTPPVQLQSSGIARLQALRPQTLKVVFPHDAGPVPVTGQTLETYVGFSSDGLAFAAGLVAPGGLHVLQFVASTTNTTEKLLPLDTDAHRAAAIDALKEDGFPGLEERPAVPKELGVVVAEGTVRLTFTSAPAGAPIKPFEGKAAGTLKAEVVAASLDGKRAAVRIQSVSDNPPLTEYHVFGVFQ
jgi:hypothetical protein